MRCVRSPQQRWWHWLHRHCQSHPGRPMLGDDVREKGARQAVCWGGMPRHAVMLCTPCVRACVRACTCLCVHVRTAGRACMHACQAGLGQTCVCTPIEAGGAPLRPLAAATAAPAATPAALAARRRFPTAARPQAGGGPQWPRLSGRGRAS